MRLSGLYLRNALEFLNSKDKKNERETAEKKYFIRTTFQLFKTFIYRLLLQM